MGVFQGTATFGLVGSYSPTSSSSIITTPNELINLAMSIAFTSGTGASQADSFVAFLGTAITGQTANIDFNTGTELTDVYGNSVTFTKLRGIVLRNRATTTGLSLTVAGDFCSSSLGLSSHVLSPSGLLVMVNPIDGFTVTQTTADVLTLQNASGSTITYDFVAWGIE